MLTLVMYGESAHARLSLAHHRVVARAMCADPALLDEARGVVSAWLAANSPPAGFAVSWQRLLQAPAATISRQIVRRNPEAEYLRGCSPFALVPSCLLTGEQSRRLWRMAILHAMRVLARSEYDDYADHLKRLGRKGRMSRFFASVSDESIDGFVARIRDDPLSVVIGHYNANVVLDGAICVSLVEQGSERFAEVGLSVLAEARHRGLGYHLLERALLWARNHGAGRFYSLFSADNETMFRLARDCRMKVAVVEAGLEGVVHILPLTPQSVSEEVLENQIGQWDFHAKAHDAAFSFVANAEPCEAGQRDDLERLVKLARFERTDVIATYVIVFRYILVQSDVSADDHARLLAALRERLEPLVADNGELRTYVAGLPSRQQRSVARYGAWHPALSHP